jgi:hypothetical protein
VIAAAPRPKRSSLQGPLKLDPGQRARAEALALEVVEPELANGVERRAEDMPLTTTISGSVEVGMIMPPGHMQNDQTPRSPSVCAVRR